MGLYTSIPGLRFGYRYVCSDSGVPDLYIYNQLRGTVRARRRRNSVPDTDRLGVIVVRAIHQYLAHPQYHDHSHT